MRQFGLIGNPLSHSFSKQYFSAKFSKEGIPDAAYELYPLNDITELLPLIENNQQLIGLNVTIPYKEAVIPFLDELDSSAAEIQAVNTIVIERRTNMKPRLIGYNTDIIGFQESLKPFLAIQHDRALIFGTGGSSKAVAYVLKKLHIPFHFVSRTPSSEKEITYTDLDTKGINIHPLLINCTPMGMSPNLDSMVPISIDGIGSNHLVYDLVYNPEESRLLREAKQRGALTLNGLSMLRLQAEAAWKIWNA